MPYIGYIIIYSKHCSDFGIRPQSIVVTSPVKFKDDTFSTERF